VVVDDIAVLCESLGVAVAGAAVFASVDAGEGVVGVVPLPVHDVPDVPVAVGVGVRVPVLPVAVDPVVVEPAAVEVVIAPPVVSGVVAGVAGFCATGAGVGDVGLDVVGGVVAVVGAVVVGAVVVGVVVVGVVVAGFAVVPVVLVCCATAGGAAIGFEASFFCASRGLPEVDGVVETATGSRTKVTPATSVFLSG
jgi:hypothetical protein